MKKQFNLSRSLLALSILLGGIGAVNAQTPAQASALAQRYSQEFQAKLSAAQFWAATNNWPVSLTLPGGQQGQLIAVEAGKPIYIYTLDRDGARSIFADKVWPGGVTGLNLSGDGVIVGIWDGGAVAENAEFGSRRTVQDGSGPADHATWVAGTAAAAGLNAAAKGVAYTARIWSYDWNNNNAEMATAAGQGVRVSNHSYGQQGGWIEGGRGDGKWAWYGDPALSQTTSYDLGFYGSGARSRDEVQYNLTNQLIVISAGNSRLEGPATQPVEHWVQDTTGWVLNSTQTRDLDGVGAGYDSLNSDATAKNPMIVAATVKNPNYSGPASVLMSSFSCFGPTDDGRIKPDISAPGVAMISPNIGGGYSPVDGTSFSSPTVAGGIALMIQQFQSSYLRAPKAVTMKAVAIHTAEEAGANPGPDYAFGWGLMNVQKACQFISLSQFNLPTLQEARINSGQTKDTTIAVGSGDQLKVTLAWMDPAANVPAKALNSRTSMLVNDLDVRVINVNTGTVYRPWTLDPANPTAAATTGDNRVDNVEQVVINNPVAGNYIVRITHKGATLKPLGGQDYTVVISAPIAGGIQSMVINPISVIGGLQSAFATVNLSATRSEPTLLQISSNNPTAVILPSTVTIPANESSITFLVNTRTVQTTQNVRVFAGSALGAVNAELEVRPVTLSSNLILSVNEIVGGNGLTGTVTLNSPAPTGGATVYLGSSAPYVAKATRNWLMIPGGQTQATFEIATFAVNDPTTVTLSARRGDAVAEAPLRVVRARISSLTSDSSVTGGNSLMATVTLDGPAPATGATVQLSSSNTGVATVPSTVTVPAGSRTKTFMIQTVRPATTTSVTITATRFGLTRQKTITVNR